jgi:hypothetical protein
VKFAVPAVVGVPEITPVEAFSVSPAGRLPDAIDHVSGEIPPLACNVALYAVPTVPEASVVVVTAGAGTTVMPTVADFVASVTDVAVSVTDRFALTGDGAVYVTPVVVTLPSVPQALPVQPVPATVHVTPAFVLSLETVAVNDFDCPWSTVCVLLGEIATAIAGGFELPPQPKKLTTERIVAARNALLMGDSLRFL